MFELLLLVFVIRKKLKVQKLVDEEIDFLPYNPGLISNKEIKDAVQEMQKNVFQAVMLIYTQILSLLEDRTVIQFQMYGLGSIWRKGILDYNSNGTFQYAVAAKLVSKFREKYPQITMTSQEPYHTPAEMEYLQNNNVHVFDRKLFSPDYFLNALANANVPNPVMICYMIHFSINHFEDFLHAHWRPEILSKIVFVGNDFDGKWCAEHIWKYKKIQAYFKMVLNRKRLPFEKPKYDYDPKIIWGNYPFHGHASDHLARQNFGNTEIYSISYEDAVKMVQKVL